MLYLTLVFFPVACAFAAYIAGRRHEGFRDIFVIAAAFAELAFSLLLLKGPADLALRGFLADGLDTTTSGRSPQGRNAGGDGRGVRRENGVKNGALV